jgi:hypothetical protein
MENILSIIVQAALKRHWVGPHLLEDVLYAPPFFWTVLCFELRALPNRQALYYLSHAPALFPLLIF